MKKRWLIPCLALLLSTPITVNAENFNGGDDWKVVFDSNKNMSSTFKNTDIDDAIYNLEPGDSVDFHLALKNEYSETTDWYMTNAVLESLEDTQSVAEGGAYTYILKYIAVDGTETTLYSSDEVGGETVNESGEGLHQATDNLEDYFYLDRLEPNQSGEITLHVELEGETQGNIYQDTLAKLQMNFAVELVGTSTTTNKKKTVVNTSSQNKLILYSILTLVAGLACAILAIYSSRQRKRGGSRR